jgi:hypothetical protein
MLIYLEHSFLILDETQDKYMLENTEGAIKNRQSRETGHIGRKYKIHSTICVGHHYA